MSTLELLQTPEPITMEEFIAAHKEETEEKSFTIGDMIKQGREQEAARIIEFAGNQFHRQQALLLDWYSAFKDPLLLFDLICSVYTNDGYCFPKKLILKAKQLAKQIPADHRLKGLPDGDPITVYRGTITWNPLFTSTLRTEISWTTDKRVAIFFANKGQLEQLAHAKKAGYSLSQDMLAKVWQATIARDKIIAYLNNRNECEILQHMGVKDPHIIDIDKSEWDSALQHHAAELQKTWDNIGVDAN